MLRDGRGTPDADGRGDERDDRSAEERGWDELERLNSQGAERRRRAELEDAKRHGKALRLQPWERLARFERHYPGVLWQPGRWPTSDGYMPFRVFHIYETEIAAHEAAERVSDVHAIALGNGAAHKDGHISDAFREDLECARLLPPRGR